MSRDTYEMDRPRQERMAGAAKLDPLRARRIGQMQANPNAKIRAYARRLIAYMGQEDREMAAHAYREIPDSIRREFEEADRDRSPRHDFDPLDRGEDLYALAQDRARSGKAGAMLDIREGSPFALSAYMDRWRAKRGEKPKRLTQVEADRLHGEIMGDYRREGLR